VAGIVFIIVELILEGLINILFKVNERDLLLQAFSDITLSGTRYHIVNISYLLAFCIFIMWIYAVIRSKFGAGPKTAIIACVIYMFAYLLFAVNHVNMNIFPLKLSLISFGLSVIELPIAVLVGTQFYKD